jgi:hypothetical protein
MSLMLSLSKHEGVLKPGLTVASTNPLPWLGLLL